MLNRGIQNFENKKTGKICQEHFKQNKADRIISDKVARIISDKVNFKARRIVRERNACFILGVPKLVPRPQTGTRNWVAQ